MTGTIRDSHHALDDESNDSDYQLDNDDDDKEYVDSDERSNSLSQERHERKRKQRREYHQKNVKEKEPCCCSVCGRHDFETITGGFRHQRECDGQSNSKGPWKCSICGKETFSTSQAFAGHWRCCNKGRDVTQSSLSLRPEALQGEFSRLSDFNKIIVDSIELFEASESDVGKQVVGSGRRNIVVGNIGIRCKHCATAGVLTVGSITCTIDLKTMPHAMYVMTKRHTLGGCQNISKAMISALEQSKKCSTSQSVRKGGLGLPAYLRILNSFLELIDGDKTGGVYRQSVHMERNLTDHTTDSTNEGIEGV